MVVPEGWEVLPIKDITETIVSGGTPSTFIQEYWNGDIPWMSSGELNLKRIYTVRKKITQKGLDNSATLFIPRGCILIGLAGQGRTRGTAGINYIPLCINQSIAAIFPNPTRFVSEYLYQYLNSKYDELRTLSMGNGGRGGLNLSIIGNLTILLPPLSEQLRIAEVLSDTDLYITTLERLIAKKEAVKQGVMQELLTGKRRLPGFKSAWAEKRLGEIVKVYNALRIPVTEAQREKGSYPYYGANGILDYVKGYTHEGEFVLLAEDGANDLLNYPVIYVNGRVWVNNHTHVITGLAGIANTRFLSYALKIIRFQHLVVGGTRCKLNSSIMSKIIISIPPTLAEQTAIAEILSDMDAELSALKKKLEKIRLIKQGMMNALLTGKIRLPEDKPNVQFTQRKEPKEILYAAEKTEEYTAEAKKAKHHANSEGYQDAVILAALVHRFGTKNFPFTAFDCQKFPYLFYRYMEGQTKGYRKFAAGPYNPALKYKTARPIALKKKYIQDHIGKYRGFISGINVQEALNYFQQWYGNEPLAWFEQFRYIPKRKDELELLTTTDMSMVEIRGEGRNITVQSVKELMKKNPEWKDKLNRPIFSDNNIERAIKWSYDLFGGEHD